MEATVPNLRMNLVSAFVSLILFIHQTHSNTCIAYTSHPGNETDREALLAFKDKVIEDFQDITSSWNKSVSHYNWPGVSCSRRHAGRVIALDLLNQKPLGTISPDIGNLTFLRRIDLEANRLRGMQYLYLQYNRLSGRIPDELRNLVERKLAVFGVSVNDLTGGIPSWLGNGSSLTDLDLGQNDLRGRIPAELGRISKLENLTLHYNNLIGHIPFSVYNLTSLVSLSVGGNSLHGEIPPEIGNYFPHLQRLYLSENRFSGQVPHSLPNATGLEELILTSNSFSGNVLANLGNLRNLTRIGFGNNQLQSGPDGLSFLTDFTNCTKLKALDFGHNKFRGEIPASVANLTNTLQVLLLGSNLITGNIPPEIEKLNGLQILAIYNNSISGEIPHGIGKLQNLKYLYLWRNRISRAIPSSLGNITQLLHLELQKNQLEGDIPPSLGWCRQLQLLTLSDNNLNGTIPNEVIGLSSLSLYFGVARNSLTGPLPLEVGNISKIVHVDLSDNRLTGEIPSTLSQCLMLLSLNMAVLDLSINNLEGEVPQEGIFRDTKRISIIGNEELCGGIKELGLPTCKVRDAKKQRKHPELKLTITVTISFLIVLTCFIVVVYQRKKSTTRPSVALPIDERFQKVSYAKLHQVTDEFSPSNLIGQGSHGSVYRGMLDGNRPVAVKVLNLKQKGAFKSFLAECEALRNIRHRNLVNIITVCSSIDFTGADFKALVYDLMRNGSLEQWLHPSENQLDMPKLSLSQRLDIAIDVASAIEYLHHHCQTSIIHGDLKPSNVLLDHDMVARVCDFGLARFLRGSTNLDASQCPASSSGLKGTIGYVAPEYGLGGTSSLQGDVYSFGILLLEMFTGIRPTDVMFKDGWTLHEFVEAALHKSLVKILDPSVLSTEYLVRIGDGQISDADMVRFEEKHC
ncbi:putative receptor-like protein kinase At3g47110 [Syzygium oleosum]|uniref:putative receptor-like protein kinase At3g47110 n=1 Tax=Syzygium oleosum TaxID=219896 RepID=UPI0024B9566E|nr:putative receptor-like protein kinase At3g47110 [Syzygium oleosum]